MSYDVKCYNIKPNNTKRWLVLGTTKEYIVTQNSCTCRDFILKTTKKEKAFCKHLAMLENAVAKKEFDTYEITIQEYKQLRSFLMDFKK